MMLSRTSRRLALLTSVLFAAVDAVQWAGEKVPYRLGDVVPVSCLNRSIETGEHITDSSGRLQYIPFPTCAETKHPLSFTYLRSRPQNCTITLTDELFHLLEFYIHNDVPMTCRLPAMHASHSHTMAPGGISASKRKATEQKEEHATASGDVVMDGPADYVPLVVGLAGELQRSHLHIANSMNVVVHTGPPQLSTSSSASRKQKKAQSRRGVGAVDSASAYSISPHETNTRIVIGDELTFVFAVTWFTGPTLTAAPNSSGGEWFFALLLGCALGFCACYASIKGVSVPESIEHFVVGKKEVLPSYNGYGYGVGSSGMHGMNGMRKGD